MTYADILAAERKLGLQLPQQYRDFLHLTNGGAPAPDCFGNSMLDTFFWIGAAEPVCDLVATTKSFAERVPTDLIPIAFDAGGNLACIGVAGRRKGKVFFWDHENEGQRAGRLGYGNVSQLAGSFDEFLSGFTE